MVFQKKLATLLLLMPLILLGSSDYYQKLYSEDPASYDRKAWYFFSASNHDRSYVLLYYARSYIDLDDKENAVMALETLEDYMESYDNHFEATTSYGRMAFLYICIDLKFKSESMLIRCEEHAEKVATRILCQQSLMSLNFYSVLVNSKQADKNATFKYHAATDNVYRENERMASPGFRMVGHSIRRLLS